MTFDEAKENIKIGFNEKKIELADEHPKELIFKLRNSRTFKLTETDIQGYADAKSQSPAFEKKPFETALISQNYCEQMIQFLHPVKSRFLPSRDLNIIFGEENAEVPFAQISRASIQYLWIHFFDKAFFELIMERLRYGGMRFIRDENSDFAENIYRPLTVKVFNLNENSIESAIKLSTRIIDGCMFSFSLQKNNPIGLLNEWPSRINLRDEEFERIQHQNNFSLPSVTFNPHLVRFFQLAASTDIESHKFLSYYHILEYHFVSISDQILYDRLSRRINDLKFRTTSNNLDRIIQDVSDYKSETDETEMLKNVLNKLIIEDELVDFIKSYEEFIKENIYTKKNIVFGVEIAGTNLQAGHVFGIIAKHVKAIRNALVHSSDRHERNSRFIPYSIEGSELIKKEVPLVRFLAEKVIIATAE